MEMPQRHVNIHMMAQSRVSDGSVRESTQEFNSGVKAQTRYPFQFRTFVVTNSRFEAEVRMYKSHITLTLTRVAIVYSTGKII